jgi:outer membrane protein insertion porin family
VKYFLIAALILNLIVIKNLKAQQTGYEIVLSGLKQTLPSDYREILQTKVSSLADSSLDALKNIFSSSLTSFGFIDNSIEVIKPDIIRLNEKPKVVVKVKEGKKYLINKVTIMDTTLKNRSNLFKELSLYLDSPLNQSNINVLSDKILKQYFDEGYIFARVKLEGFKKIFEDENEIQTELNFWISPERKSLINNVLVEGNDLTDKKVIIREIRIKDSDVFNQALSEKITQRLKRLSIFSRIDTPEYFIDHDDKGILKLSVKEGNSNSFDGIIGYIPAASTREKGYFSGLVNVSFRNLFGTMRAFSFRWQQVSKASQDLEMNYFEPWLFGLPINLYPSFFQRKQDSTYVQRNFGLKSEVLISEFLSFNLAVNSERVIPSAERGVIEVYNSASISVGGGIKYDTRDDFFFPREGLIFKTDYFYIRKKISNQTNGTNTSIDLRKIIADFDYYQPIFSNHIFTIGLHGRELRGNEFEISDLFKLGGTNTLRGYEENQFSGSRLLWLNNEYRVLLDERNFVFIFLDVGYYFRNIMNENLSRVKYGYGLGVAVDSPLGILKVNYALGEGDSISTGKIHLGIINAF